MKLQNPPRVHSLSEKNNSQSDRYMTLEAILLLFQSPMRGIAYHKVTLEHVKNYINQSNGSLEKFVIFYLCIQMFMYCNLWRDKKIAA